MAKAKRKTTKKSRKPKPMKIAALIVSAIQDLRETKGSTPRKIAGYISFASKVPEDRVKRRVNTALKRGVEYGILRRYRGHYFLPSGDEVDRANRIAVRFARLPASAPLDLRSSIGQAARRAIENAAYMGEPKNRKNEFPIGNEWPTSHSLPVSAESSCTGKLFDRKEFSIESDVE